MPETDNEKMERVQKFVKMAGDALRLIDLQNQTTKSYTVYNKDKLRTALKNPLSDTNSKELRHLS